MAGRNRIAAALLFASATADSGPVRADRGDLDFALQAGVPLYSHKFAVYGETARSESPGDVARLSEQAQTSFFFRDRVRGALALQITHALTAPDPSEEPSRLTSVQIQPGLGLKVAGPVSVGLAAVLAPRVAGQNDFGFGLQPSIDADVEIGRGFSASATLQVQTLVVPTVEVEITPLLGLSYATPIARRPR